MRSFLEVLKFELRLQLMSPIFGGLCVLFFAIHLLTMAQVGIHLTDNQLIDYNSAYLIFRAELVLSVFGVAPAILFVVNAASRDEGLGTTEFFYTTPIPRLSFLLGRYAGAVLCTLLVGLAGTAGLMAGTLMPGLEPDRVAAFDLSPYALAFGLVVVPNLLVIATLAFCLALLSRGPVLSFAMVLGFIVFAVVINSGPALQDGPLWATMLDPFGAVPVERTARYWSVVELNSMAPTQLLPANRLLWLSLAAAALAATTAIFRVERAAGRSRLKGLRLREAQAAPAPAATPQAGRFGPFDTLAQFTSQWGMDLRGVLLSPLFWLVLTLTVFGTVGQIQSNVSALMGLPMHPTTGRMLGNLRFGLMQFVLIVIIFYSGLLMHRERDHRLHEILGAAPYPDWLPLVSKVLSLCAVLMLLLGVSVLTCIGWQAMAGHHDFKLGVYLEGVFLFSGFYFCMLAVLACLIQVLSPGKWAGMVLVTVALIILMSLEAAGFEHVLYGFRIPFVRWSDMNGFDRAPQAYALMAYWGALCVLLIVAGHLLYPRGAREGLVYRLRQSGRRFTPGLRVATLAATAVFAGMGGYIFYDTNILNAYQTAASRLRDQAQYERRYGAYKQALAPAASDIDLAIDLYPRERRLKSSGAATLRNSNAAPLTTLFLTTDPRLEVETLAIEGGRKTFEDRKHSVFIFALDTPLAPGAETRMTWTASRHARGFPSGAPEIEVLENGTFVSLADVMPRASYDGERELTDSAERKRQGLAPAPRLPALGDPAWINRLGFGGDARTEFRVVFSTDKDQTAVAPGVLAAHWTRGDRRYFDYRMERPTRPAISLSSGRYQVARRRSDGVDIEVYYDADHPWNVQAMLDTSETSLAYFSREFAPYPLSHFRIVEFPGYRSQAQAFAGTIAYSETVGFTNDLRGFSALDYATIHELAHQWWGGLAYGARMQGREILNEGLAQYSTFMIYKQQPDPAPLRQILAKTHSQYLAARGEEREAEQPVLLSEDQGYISYNKASLAMFALQELLGEDKVHQALRAYLGKFAMKGPPYPTSRDLVNELRAVAGPEHQGLITDLFEKIMFYDVKVMRTTSRRVADGYEVTLDVVARQLEADGKGKETEVRLDAPFQVVIFPASDRDPLTLKPLYQAHHRLRSGAQRITVRVPAAPGAVGVDPFHLMIDRTPGDNILRSEASRQVASR